MNLVVIFIVVVAACGATSINLLERDDEENLFTGHGNPARRQTGVNLGWNTHSGQPQLSAGQERVFNGGNTKVGANVNVGLNGKPNFDFSASHKIDDYTKLNTKLNVGQQGPSFDLGISRDNPNGPSWYGRVGFGRGGPSFGAGLKFNFKKRNSLTRA